MVFMHQLQYYAERIPWNGFKPYGKYKELQGNSVLLGLKGRKTRKGFRYNYNKPVYLDFGIDSNNPLNLLIMGRKGAGKTTISASIGFQLWKYFQCNLFIIDPQANIPAFKYPQTNPTFLHYLEEAGVKSEPMPLHVLTPKFFRGSPKFKNTDTYYSVSMDDIISIDEFSFKRQLLASLLGVEDQEPSMRKLDEVMATDPQSFERFKKELENLNKSNKFFDRIKVLDNNFKRRLSEGVISDYDKVDIVKILNNQPVGLQCSLSTEDKINMTYIAFALYSIKAGMEAGKIEGKTVFVTDEADILAPSGNKNPPSKIPLEHMSTKWRKDGAIPINLVQDPARLSTTILQQVDAVLTPAIGYNTSEENFIRSKFPNVSTMELMQLHYGKSSNYPKEWALITSQGIETFYPLPNPFLMTL